MSRLVALVLIFSLSLNVYLLAERPKNSTNVTSSSEEKNLAQANNTANNQQGQITIHSLSETATSRGTSTEAKVATLSPEKSAVSELIISIKNNLLLENYREASTLLNELSQLDQQKSKEIEDYWWQHSKNLLTKHAIAQAESSIVNFLSFDFDNIRFLHLEVELLKQKNEWLSAVNKAYDMQYYVYESAQQKQSIEFARQLVNEIAEQYSRQKNWDKLAELAQFSLNLDPQFEHYQWLYSQALFNLGQYQETLTSLTPLLSSNNYRIPANKLYQQTELAILRPVTIPLTKRGEHYFVDGTINQFFNVHLMLDTGAGISLLTPSSYDALKRRTTVTFVEEVTLNTAGGQITSAIYQVPEFSIGHYKIKNFNFAVSPYMNEGSDGLLGMNYLKHFNFYLDQQNQGLVLSTKP